MSGPDLSLDDVMTMNQQRLGVVVDLMDEAVGGDDFEGANPLAFSFLGLGGDFAFQHDGVAGRYLLGLNLGFAALKRVAVSCVLGELDELVSFGKQLGGVLSVRSWIGSAGVVQGDAVEAGIAAEDALVGADLGRAVGGAVHGADNARESKFPVESRIVAHHGPERRLERLVAALDNSRAFWPVGALKVLLHLENAARIGDRKDAREVE